MTQSARGTMRPWLATLIGIAIFLVVSSFVGVTAHPGIVALMLLIATAAGGFAASKLSGRRGPAWGAGAVGLLTALSYLLTHNVDPATLPVWLTQNFRQTEVPLWLVASLLGSPLLGARLGAAAAGR